ncbi:MAG: hypothetical protein JXB06_07105, partial [Spirochaetales bacterium]|nr:hypothetical protein [Spirochaetales bacterium]
MAGRQPLPLRADHGGRRAAAAVYAADEAPAVPAGAGGPEAAVAHERGRPAFLELAVPDDPSVEQWRRLI